MSRTTWWAIAAVGVLVFGVASAGTLTNIETVLLRIRNGSYFTTVQGQTQSANITLRLPASPPTAGKVLAATNDGGVLDWVVQAGSGGSVSGTVGNIPKFTSTTAVGNSVASDNGTAFTIPEDVVVGGGAAASNIKLLEPSGSGANFTALKAQAQAADITLIMPSVPPLSGKVLGASGDGGVLVWVDQASAFAGCSDDGGVIACQRTLQLQNPNAAQNTFKRVGALGSDFVTNGDGGALYIGDDGEMVGTQNPSDNCYILRTTGVLHLIRNAHWTGGPDWANEHSGSAQLLEIGQNGMGFYTSPISTNAGQQGLVARMIVASGGGVVIGAAQTTAEMLEVEGSTKIHGLLSLVDATAGIYMSRPGNGEFYNWQTSTSPTGYVYGLFQNGGGQYVTGVVDSTTSDSVITGGVAYGTFSGSYNNKTHHIVQNSATRIRLDTNGDTAIPGGDLVLAKTVTTKGSCAADSDVGRMTKYSKSAGATISVCVCQKLSNVYGWAALGTGDCT